MKATKGMKVQAQKNSCIGIAITSITYTGTVAKVNKKNFIVEFESMKKTFGRKAEIDDQNYTGKVKFNLWKTLEDGTEVYKNQLYGFIEM